MDLEGPVGDTSFDLPESGSPTPRVLYYYVLPPGSESGYDSKNSSFNESPSKSNNTELTASASPLHVLQNVAAAAPETKSDSCPITTFIFFDLETTGLPQFNGAINTQITEISLLAIAKDDFERSQNNSLTDVRVLNKLSLCVKPRCSVDFHAGRITGLDNKKLEFQHHFDESTAQMIVNFIMHVPQPVCLLAHNGNVFDFPLLKAELNRVGTKLPSSVLVADTLIAIRSFQIFGPPNTEKAGKNSKIQRNFRSNSLENLYRYFFKKKPLNKHSSEGDCVALMMVCHKLKDDILPWIYENHKLLEDIKPMW